MTPEERFAEYVMWVLNGIKEESLATLEGEPIEYNYSHVGAAGVPSNDTEEKILYKLQEWKAIKITDLIDTTSDFEGRFYLEILQPKFDETYNQYKKLASPATRIVNGFSSENLPFVLFVLKGIISAAEFSTENEIKYKLQSPAGEQLMRERQLLSKLQSFDILWSYGEDGIFAVATFRDVKIDAIKDMIGEIEKRLASKPELQEQPGYNEISEVKIEWSENFSWISNREFNLGNETSLKFGSASSTKIELFRMLVDAKGNWVRVLDMSKEIDQKPNYVRATIGGLNKSLKDKIIRIVAKDDTEEQGAYRIKILNS